MFLGTGREYRWERGFVHLGQAEEQGLSRPVSSASNQLSGSTTADLLSNARSEEMAISNACSTRFHLFYTAPPPVSRHDHYPGTMSHADCIQNHRCGKVGEWWLEVRCVFE